MRKRKKLLDFPMRRGRAGTNGAMRGRFASRVKSANFIYLTNVKFVNQEIYNDSV